MVFTKENITYGIIYSIEHFNSCFQKQYSNPALQKAKRAKEEGAYQHRNALKLCTIKFRYVVAIAFAIAQDHIIFLRIPHNATDRWKNENVFALTIWFLLFFFCVCVWKFNFSCSEMHSIIGASFSVCVWCNVLDVCGYLLMLTFITQLSYTVYGNGRWHSTNELHRKINHEKKQRKMLPIEMQNCTNYIVLNGQFFYQIGCTFDVTFSVGMNQWIFVKFYAL